MARSPGRPGVRTPADAARAGRGRSPCRPRSTTAGRARSASAGGSRRAGALAGLSAAGEVFRPAGGEKAVAGPQLELATERGSAVEPRDLSHPATEGGQCLTIPVSYTHLTLPA